MVLGWSQRLSPLKGCVTTEIVTNNDLIKHTGHLPIHKRFFVSSDTGRLLEAGVYSLFISLNL